MNPMSEKRCVGKYSGDGCKGELIYYTKDLGIHMFNSGQKYSKFKTGDFNLFMFFIISARGLR